MNLRPSTPLALLLALAVSGLHAADKLDLSRVTPVADTEQIPLADFFRPRLLTNVRLNPSGTHYAALITAAEDRYSLMVTNLSTGTFEVVHGAGRKDVSGIAWMDDTHLLSSLAESKKWGLGLFAQEVGKISSGYPLLQFTAVRLISVPRKDRTHPLVWIGRGLEDGIEDIGVAKINSKLNSGPMLVARDGSITNDDYFKARETNRRHILDTFNQPKEGIGSGSYIADKDGELAFCVTGNDGFEKLHRLVDGKWVDCPVNLDDYWLEDVGEKPGEIVVRPKARTDKPQPLQFMDATTGQLGDVILQDKGYDPVGTIYRDRKTGNIAGVQYSRSGPRPTWFDERYAKAQKTLETQFPGQVVGIIDSNEDATIFVFTTSSDHQPAKYSWVNMATQKAGLIKETAPWIDPKRMQAMNVMKFKTRDGRQLDAYLTLPAGATKENPPPLVVLCHGGPWTRDEWGFDGEVQFLASRGYAVMQPNYRGSTGYDWMFPEEDRYAFVKMHEDVTDATRTIIKTGLIDSKRVAIMGGSFGGYLGLSGVSHEPELYRCAVLNAGVFDWTLYMREEKYFQYWDNTYAYLKRKLGDPGKEREKYTAISPINFVEKVRVPVFVAYGKDDHVVSPNQSERLVRELNSNHIPNDVIYFREEGHGTAHLKNTVELYSRIEAFLAKNLLPKP